MELVAALSITLAIVSIIMCLGMAMQLDSLRKDVESLNKRVYSLYVATLKAMSGVKQNCYLTLKGKFMPDCQHEACMFSEPWIGLCKEPRVKGGIVCVKHAEEKCQVCGDQAYTRCQASRGLMCGIPLCDQCGHGEMCLYHAGSGPLMVIKAILGGGPEPTVFSCEESLAKTAARMKEVATRLKAFGFKPTMQDYDKFVAESKAK